MTNAILCKCQRCGKDVLKYPYEIGKRVYCSRQCYADDNRLDHSPLWRGGRFLTYQGYVRVSKPEHPEANGHGYVLEHRLVAEAKLGRLLEKDEVVHHLNGIRTDNRPENIIVIPKGTHTRIHRSNAIYHIWANDYDYCVCCFSNKSRHTAHGLCTRCDTARREGRLQWTIN